MQTTLMALCLWLRMPRAAALCLGSAPPSRALCWGGGEAGGGFTISAAAPPSRALCWGGGEAGGIHHLCSFVGKLAYLDSLGDAYQVILVILISGTVESDSKLLPGSYLHL